MTSIQFDNDFLSKKAEVNILSNKFYYERTIIATSPRINCLDPYLIYACELTAARIY